MFKAICDGRFTVPSFFSKVCPGQAVFGSNNVGNVVVMTCVRCTPIGWHVFMFSPINTPHNCRLVSSKMRCPRASSKSSNSHQFHRIQELKDLVRRLLCKQPLRRLGAKGAAEVRRHPWFAKFDWRGLGKRGVRAPYVPKVCPAGVWVVVGHSGGRARGVDAPLRS